VAHGLVGEPRAAALEQPHLRNVGWSVKYAGLFEHSPGVKDMAARNKAGKDGQGEIGKRVTFDPATWYALDLYARESMKSFQELADEAFADLLAKHNRPVDLKDALRRSTRSSGANDNAGGRRR